MVKRKTKKRKIKSKSLLYLIRHFFLSICKSKNAKNKFFDVKSKIYKQRKKEIKLERYTENPIISPRPYAWESQAVFNPAAVYSNGKVHLFYRALGDDGISRIGYASSEDGINFYDRLYYPVYSFKKENEMKKHWPFTSPARPYYDRALYASGGGWGGCEDPRAVVIDGEVYITMNIFNGWNNMGVGYISINEDNLLKRKWKWSKFTFLSHPGDRQKNWVLFPEKINGKFVVFHNLDKGDPNKVYLTYTNNLHWSNMPTIKDALDPQTLPDHVVAWHRRTRSASAPPIKTKDGWLLLYHAMDKDGSDKYKLGAMLLDINDPSKVLYRAQTPILESEEWYENNWKPGIIYASGAIIKNSELIVYYGGGDKYIGVASISVDKLIESMKKKISVKLEKKKKLKIN